MRESGSSDKAFVLSFRSGDKVLHNQINTYYDSKANTTVLSLDKGATKFYDLTQLVEFYELNRGALQIRLTEHIKSPAEMPSTSGQRRTSS